jgi:hypothetical protein
MTKIMALVLSFLFIQPATTQLDTVEETTNKPTVQIALLLDTSNSMDGLIDQAKSQLWKMVNELATTKKRGVTPQIELALFEYGNSGLAQAEHYIRRVTELTTDLDLVSDQLFRLATNGGDEYCGAVIENARLDLNWSDDPGDLKLIFIAGNEPFTQGPVDFRRACQEAIAQGIQINTIYCGDYDEGVNTQWKEGADLADGEYMNIDQSQEVVHIPTPFDQEILELNSRLNETYIGYGSMGAARKEMQMAQDENAAEYGAANAAVRAEFKASESYDNSEWDLVDAAEDAPEMVAELAEEELPEEMQGLTEEERVEYVEEKAKERAAIQEEIRGLREQAEAFRTEKLAEMHGDAEISTLDKVMLEAVRKQANAKEFETPEN